ncbi:MAG: sulfatase, partial [Micavibrio aeruginosavorus]
MKSIFSRLVPFAALFLVVQTAVRCAFLWYSADHFVGEATSLTAAFALGLVFDLGVFVYYALPILFYALLLPQRLQGTQLDKNISTGIFFVFSYILLFTAVGEYFFWDEFESRYNFIAVDYL